MIQKFIKLLYKKGVLRLIDLAIWIIPRYLKTVLFLSIADNLKLKNLRFDMPLILSNKSKNTYFMNMTAIPGDRSVLPFIAHKQMWEIIEPQMCISYMEDNKSYEIIDAGANMGMFTLQLLAMLKQNDRISQITDAHLIEPDPSLTPAIKNNCEQFSTQNINFNIIEKAIGSEDGHATFYLDKGNNTNNSLRPEAIETSVDSAEEIKVEVLSGKSLINTLHLNKNSRIIYKSDLQGSDTDVMLSIPDTFWHKVDIIIVEIWPMIFKKVKLDMNKLSSIISQYNYVAKIDQNGNIKDLTDDFFKNISSARSKYTYYNLFCARTY